MTLSVIIPVYNVAPYLRRCVGSVLNQTYRDLEIILVDDGSTDESGAICDEYASASFASLHHSIIPIKVIHKPNGGLSDARNAGLKVATGEYVAFLEDGIEQMMRRMEQKQSDILLFKRVDIYPNKRQYSHDYDADYIRSHSAQEVFEQLILSEHFNMSACFQILRRKVLIDNNITFPVGYISEDVDFSCCLWQKAQKIDVLNIDMYGYHHRENSISTSYSIRSLRSYDKMFTYWKEQIVNHCINHYAIGVFMANLFVSCCYSYLSVATENRSEAKQILLQHHDLLNYAASRKTLRMKMVTYGRLKKSWNAFSQG